MKLTQIPTMIAISLTLLILMLSTKTFAFENGQNRGSARDQMTDYIEMKKPWDQELAQIQSYLVSEIYKYDNDVANMDINTLNEYIHNQKDYILTKQLLTDRLAEIYFPNHRERSKSLDTELAMALKKYRGKCNIWERISEVCFRKHEGLVYQAEYLNQKIGELENLESSLTFAITDLIYQQDKDSSNIFISKNTIRVN